MCAFFLSAFGAVQRLDFGLLTLVCGVLHGVTHIVRCLYESGEAIMYATPMYRSGLVAMLLLLPTALPMSIGFLKDKVGRVRFSAPCLCVGAGYVQKRHHLKTITD